MAIKARVVNGVTEYYDDETLLPLNSYGNNLIGQDRDSTGTKASAMSSFQNLGGLTVPKVTSYSRMNDNSLGSRNMYDIMRSPTGTTTLPQGPMNTVYDARGYTLAGGKNRGNPAQGMLDENERFANLYRDGLNNKDGGFMDKYFNG